MPLPSPTRSSGRSSPPHPTAPVVVNVNVPNLPLSEIAGWRRAEVGYLPPRTVSAARLDAVAGRQGVYAVHLEWGDAVELPPESDGGAIERNEITVSFLSRLVDEPRDDVDGVGAALDSTAVVGALLHSGHDWRGDRSNR